MELRDTPARNVGLILNFTSMNQILHGSTFQSQGTGQEYRPLGSYLSSWFSKEESLSRIACVVHSAKDGIVAAERLAVEFDDDKKHVVKWGVDRRNRTVDANELQQFIKKKSLIHAAKAKNLWKRPPVFTELFITALGIIVIPMLTYVLDNNFLPPLLAGIFLLMIAVNYVCKYWKCREEGFRSLTAAVKDFSFNEYQDFVNRFSSRDFLCAKYSATANDDIIIVRDIHTPRHFLLLKQYLSNIKDDQIWVIFLEQKDIYNDFLLEKTDFSEKKIYYLKPLEKAEKKELAKASNIPADDPAIRHWGVDYILRNSVRISELISSEGDRNLTNQIQEFIHEKVREREYLNLATLIRFVAQLRMEFFPGPIMERLWDQLFDYQASPLQLNQIDRELSIAVFCTMTAENSDSVLKSIKGIVFQILHTFGNDLEDILDNQFIKSNSYAIGAYEQLLIVKALRFQGKAEIERCVALGESLMRSVWGTKQELGDNWHNVYARVDWREIFISALGFLENSEVRWFSPWIVHSCVEIYRNDTRYTEPFFSREPMLAAARSNILLDPDDAESDHNMVSDHFAVVRCAVLERGREDALRGGRKYPDSFSLINLENKERKEYYNALKVLKEETILRFYDYLFDIFCATWSYAYNHSEARLWCAEIARNDLYRKYHSGRSRLEQPLPYYLRTIVTQLLEMIEDLYGNEAAVSTVVSSTAKVLSGQLAGNEREQALLWLIPQAEMSAYAILVFSACTLCRLETDEVSRETFMGLGNYLIRMIFLTLHERSGFVNDDFKELINIMTHYEEPNNVILGFLSQSLSHMMPRGIYRQIADYLNIHRDAYAGNLGKMTSHFAVNDGEKLIHIVMLANMLTETEKVGLYNNIRNRMEREFSSSPRKAVCDELLSVLADKKVSPTLDDVSTEEIVQKLRDQYSSNTAYILFDGYLEIDRGRFLPYCPMIVGHLLNSTYTGCWRPVLMYLTETASEEISEEHNMAACCLYQYCHLHTFNRIPVLQRLISFLSTLLRKKGIYRWVNETATKLKIREMLNRIDEIRTIEAMAVFNRRKWSRYGILSYVKFLLKSDIRFPVYNNDEYAAMSSENKLAYCKNFFSTITPFVKDEDGMEVVNPIYMDLLDFLIDNKGDIQNHMGQYSGLQKIATDTIAVVQHLFTDQKSAEQVIHLIRAYIQNLSIRDL